MKLFDYRTILLNQAKKRTTETLCGSSLWLTPIENRIKESVRVKRNSIIL